jgi:hypothetical protein
LRHVVGSSPDDYGMPKGNAQAKPGGALTAP